MSHLSFSSSESYHIKDCLVIHALISPRRDYCNCILVSTGLHSPQQVQNPAARLLCRWENRGHITPAVASLLKFLTRFFSLCLRAAGSHSELHHRAPHYSTAESCRSTDQDLSATVAAPRLWNLPSESFRTAESHDCVKRCLKTLLYSHSAWSASNINMHV